MTPAEDYFTGCQALMQTLRDQQEEIAAVADRFAAAILAGRVVHLFGSGHSRIMVEEMWPRYGSFPGFHPMVELSLTYHNPVVGSNGQRQAMYLENVTGLAECILSNYALSSQDAALVVSSGGCNLVPIEMAEGFRRRGIFVVGLVSLAHCVASVSRRPDGRKLIDFADVVLDTGAPVGDAMVRLAGLDIPVAPGSSVGGCMMINAVKAEIAARLVKAGQPPRVLAAPALVGAERSRQLFESAYDEHGRRVGPLLARPEQ